MELIFESNLLVSENSTVRNFVKNSGKGHCSVLINEAHYIVVKEIEKRLITLEKVRATAGNIARDLSSRKIRNAYIDEEILSTGFGKLKKEDLVIAFVEGWELGSYQFLKYKSSVTPLSTRLEVAGKDIEGFVHEGIIRAEATAFSRDLMNETSSVLNPKTFPKVLKKNFEGTNVEVNVFGKDELEKMGMNGVLTVGQGSRHKPSFVELIYKGDESKPLIALVGKGVTFDSGGISLKSGRDLSDMRLDMGGAAAVSGALTLLAKSNAKVNVVGLIPIVENMLDNKSVLPGEVIQYKNGLTVQVGNTDFEGRLILADALIRAGEWNAEYIIDIATLTGAIVNALGTEIAGVFGEDSLTATLKMSGDRNGDYVWPMPLVDAYESSLDSDYADMNNISSLNEAGSITASLFLRRFVPKESKWAHIDMVGMMNRSKAGGYYPKSAPGFGTRLLADVTKHISNG